MKSNTKTVYVCQSCGAQFPKWMGRCGECGAWNSVVEEIIDARASTPSASRRTSDARIQSLDKIEQVQEKRVFTGITELDRVLGGGIVPGSLLLLSGDPGIGKSTLLLQALHALAQRGFSILYASGEESAQQIKLRADRTHTVHGNIHLSNEINIFSVIESARQMRPFALVVDSIQTMSHPDVPSSPGSVSQIRECTAKLLELAKGENIATWIVGHVTKEGNIAGPRVLEHLVDCVMYLEGDTSSGYRVLRAVKNRFGSTGEIGIFSMQGAGLAPVANPSAFFLQERQNGLEGSAVSISIEGSRPLLVEIQALVTKTHFPSPRRVVTGLDFNRFTILAAVLEKRAGLYFSNYDVYATVAGGLKLTEPASDLAAAAAMASSLMGRPLPPRFAYFGEVGLSGEVRPAPYPVERILEAAKMGFERIYLPKRNFVTERKRIDEALAQLSDEVFLYPVENVSEVVTLQK